MERTRFERLLYYLTVPRCIFCDEIIDIDDFAFCKACSRLYLESRERKCSVCLKPIDRCVCSNKYLETHFVRKLIKLFRYKPSYETKNDRAENTLIYNLKTTSRRDVVRFCAKELSERIKQSVKYENYVITNVPRSGARRRRFGMDHMATLARQIAKLLGIEYVSPLRSRARGIQKKQKGEDRMRNAAFDYKRGYNELPGTNVLLLDDVVTTGASLGGCAMLLRGLGAKSIIGVCLGIAYSDKYTPLMRTERL